MATTARAERGDAVPPATTPGETAPDDSAGSVADDAFESVWQRWRLPMVQLAVMLVDSREAAEDVVREPSSDFAVAGTAWTIPPRICGGACGTGWLIGLGGEGGAGLVGTPTNCSSRPRA